MTRRVLVYGDVDLNLIDGSAVWLQSMVQALSGAGCEVTLTLKAPVRTSRLLEPLLAMDGVTVRRPVEEKLVPGVSSRGLSAEDAVLALRAVDGASDADGSPAHDVVVVRGRRLAAALAADPSFTGRLWSYLTDVPQSLGEADARSIAELTAIAESSRLLLCQTEELRCFLEQLVPAACGKCVLFPPVVPQITAAPRTAAGKPLGLVYSGKFALRWNTYEMAELPALLADRGIDATLHMVGDKIHDEPTDPAFAARMRARLSAADGVVWHGGIGRREAFEVAAGADIGLSWRAPELDASLELSTKVLEFGALGLPVVLNRTPMHENLLGEDYPLFAASQQDVADVLAMAAGEDEVYRLAANRCHAAARAFTLDRAAERIRGYLDQFCPDPVGQVGGRALRVAVAGHDLKFFTGLLDRLGATPGIEVRVDRWDSLAEHDEQLSREVVEWADVIVCEWCATNAIWYSRHKRPGQRLLVRLHRFELYAPWPREIDIAAVDTVICVSDHYKRLTVECTGWPEEKIVAIPNWVDVEQLDRPKLPDARFAVGMIGVVPARKRLDRGLDVIAELRRHDPRFTLRIKSKLPWEYWWIWKEPAEQEHYRAVLRRMRGELADAVVFDPYGTDVANWLRRIGFVLSTSDDESFHLAPAEGMASRAVPALLNWPGATTIYQRRWVHDDPAGIAEAIVAQAEPEAWRSAGEAARQEVRDAYALERVTQAWRELLRKV